jgi:hypothetical protein
MKDIEYRPELPLMEVQEIFEDQWKHELAEAVNKKGRDVFYDERVKIVDKIDVWDIK